MNVNFNLSPEAIEFLRRYANPRQSETSKRTAEQIKQAELIRRREVAFARKQRKGWRPMLGDTVWVAPGSVRVNLLFAPVWFYDQRRKVATIYYEISGVRQSARVPLDRLRWKGILQST